MKTHDNEENISLIILGGLQSHFPGGAEAAIICLSSALDHNSMEIAGVLCNLILSCYYALSNLKR